MRVLVVERSPFLRLVLREVLARANYTTVGECDELEDAATLAGSLEPDVILVDLDGSDREFQEKIGELRKWAPSTRLIALGPPGKPLVGGTGVEAYLSKPCTPEAVLAAIRREYAADGMLMA